MARPVARVAAPAGLLAAIVLVTVVYAAAITGPLQFDDHATIAIDPGAQSLAAWWSGAARHVRPLTKATFALTHGLGTWLGDVPTGHHVGNLLIHLAAIAAFYALGRSVCDTCLPRVDAARASDAAALAAAAFGLHPLATEAVSYVGGRSMALGTVLAALSLWAYIRWRSAGGGAWAWVAFASCAGAVLARETAFVTPALWLLWEALRSPDTRPPQAGSPARWAGLRSASWSLAMLVVFAAWLLTHSRYSALLEVSGRIALRQALEPSLLAALQYFGAGLALLRYPSIDPDVTPALMSPLVRVAGTVALVALAALAWRRRRTAPQWLLGLAWILVWIGPVYLVRIRYDALSERHFYPAIWGATFAIAVTLAGGPQRSALRRRAARAAAVLAIAAMTLVTFARNTDYRSEVALWEAARRSAPDRLRVLNNLGVAYMEAGRWDDASAVLDHALALDPLDLQLQDNQLAARERDLGTGRWARSPGSPDTTK